MSFQAHLQQPGLAVDAALRGTLSLGLLEAAGLSHAPLGADFARERDAVVTQRVGRDAGRPPSDIAGVAEVRALFHRLGVDPTKTRPSSEALLRRVLQGKGLPEVSPVVDVCNLCSLEHQLPLGLYDRGQVRGTIHVRVGREGEGYDGIRKQRIHLTGRLLLADDEGPFGAPTSDSLRTSVTSRTAGVLVVVFAPPERSGPALSALLESLADRITRHCAATVSSVRVIQ